MIKISTKNATTVNKNSSKDGSRRREKRIRDKIISKKHQFAAKRSNLVSNSHMQHDQATGKDFDMQAAKPPTMTMGGNQNMSTSGPVRNNASRRALGEKKAK